MQLSIVKMGGGVRVSYISDDDNLIIKGNNLIALYSLEKRFAGKVKLIYLDPPYNTGTDSFLYNDRFNQASWLTFMKNRLEICKNMLSDEGHIVIQTDDTEQAYLKVLMDEIFKKENYVNTISVLFKNIAGASGGGEDKRLKKNIEYLTIYAKNYSFSNPFNRSAFKITVKLLKIIAKLAIIGLMVIPNGVKTPIAIGIIKEL